MDSDHQELYLQKLQSFVLDEDKIVTYSWLSRTLNLDVGATKTLLRSFLTDHRSLKPKEIGVSYILLGKRKDNEINSIVVVKEDDLDEKRKLFENVKETVYSIQKSKDVDLNAVGMVDMFDLNGSLNKPLLGSVVGSNCVKRNLKAKIALPEINRAAPTDKSKASHLFTKGPVKTELVKKEVKDDNANSPKTSDSLPVKKEANGKPQSGRINKTKPAQKGNLKNLFSKMPSKTEIKPEVTAEPVETKMDVDEESAPQNGSKKNEFYDSDTDEEAKKVERDNKLDKPVKEEVKSAKKKKATKRQRKSTGLEQPQKRRKRIIERNQSDSDDMFGDDQEDEEEHSIIPVSDDEPEVKMVVPALAPKNKKRKYVSKTSMDEDGYMVTERVVEYVSASDEEDKEQVNPQVDKKPVVVEKKPEVVEKPKKPAKKENEEASPPKGAKGKKKGKQPGANQPTLMSFFKKK